MIIAKINGKEVDLNSVVSGSNSVTVLTKAPDGKGMISTVVNDEALAAAVRKYKSDNPDWQHMVLTDGDYMSMAVSLGAAGLATYFAKKKYKLKGAGFWGTAAALAAIAVFGLKQTEPTIFARIENTIAYK